MFYVNHEFLIKGGSFTLNWNVSSKKEIIFLWRPTSFWFWKNYSIIPISGHVNLIAKGKQFEAKIFTLYFFKFKKIHQIMKQIHTVSVLNTEINPGLIKGTDLANIKKNVLEVASFKLSKSTAIFSKKNTPFSLNVSMFNSEN